MRWCVFFVLALVVTAVAAVATPPPPTLEQLWTEYLPNRTEVLHGRARNLPLQGDAWVNFGGAVAQLQPDGSFTTPISNPQYVRGLLGEVQLLGRGWVQPLDMVQGRPVPSDTVPVRDRQVAVIKSARKQVFRGRLVEGFIASNEFLEGKTVRVEHRRTIIGVGNSFRMRLPERAWRELLQTNHRAVGTVEWPHRSTMSWVGALASAGAAPADGHLRLLGVGAGQLGANMAVGAGLSVAALATRDLCVDGRVNWGALGASLTSGQLWKSLSGGAIGAAIGSLLPGGPLLKTAASVIGAGLGAGLATGELTRSPGQLLAGTVGSAVGAALLVGVPVVGPLVGGAVGQVAGQWLHGRALQALGLKEKYAS